MIIENPTDGPPKVVFRPIWVCPLCGRTMIFEKGVNRLCIFKRKTICFDCDSSMFTDAVQNRKRGIRNV